MDVSARRHQHGKGGGRTTRPKTPEDATLEDEMAAAARRAASHMVKVRARHYARRPMTLDTLHPGLSRAAPATLIAVAEHLVERETRSARRWFGFGGEVSLLNARAALLLGRARRRKLAAQEIQQKSQQEILDEARG